MYAYDAAARLVGVTAPGGQTARYRYDAAGNRLGVDRFASSVLSVLSLVPVRAASGASVTLSGTGFSTTAASNKVTFGTKTASVTSASATRLVVTVPSGAVKGPVSVAVGTASAASAETFTPALGNPSVTSYAPTSGPPGTVVVLSGSGFASVKTDNVVRFAGGRIAEVVERTDTALTVKVPPGAKAGRITVETPDGQQTAPDYFDVPLEGNEFETTVGTSPTDETPPSVTISASDKRARVLIDADAGDSLTFHLSGSTFQGDLRLRMISPQDVELHDDWVRPGEPFDWDLTDLPVSGTYSLVIEPADASTGPGTVTVTASLPLEAGRLAPTDATPAPVSLTRPGQKARATFEAQKGDDLTIGALDSTFTGGAVVTVQAPSGQIVTVGGPSVPGASATVELMNLPETGAYVVTVDPKPGDAGTLGLLMSADIKISLSPDAAFVSVAVRRGQQVQAEFTAPPGRIVGAGITDVTIPTNSSLQARDAEGKHVGYGTVLANRGGSLHLNDLVAGNNYAVVLQPQSASAGSMKFWLSTPVTAAPLTTSSPSTQIELTRPGQQLVVPVLAADNSGISVVLSGTNEMQGGSITRVGPGGQVVYNAGYIVSGGAGVALPTPLPEGTHLLRVLPLQTTAGTVTASRVPAVNAGTLTLGGAKRTAVISQPHVHSYFTFTVEAQNGAKPDLEIEAPSPFDWFATLIGSAGEVRGSTYISKTTVSASLASLTPGTYTLVIAQIGPSTGQVTLGIKDRSATGASSGGDRAGAARIVPEGADAWQPGKQQKAGRDWVTGRGDGPDAPRKLRSPSGATALTGHVLKLDGKPLARVTVSVGDKTARTDSRGRFLLAGISSDVKTLVVDGSTANTRKRQYGRFDIHISPKTGQSVDLGFPVWMTPLDTKNTVSFAAPAKSDIVLKTPKIPGLEVRIPKGSVVRDEKGNPVTEMGITAIPIDRPPFPLPENSVVPVYFTVQPGGTYVFPKGAQIIYPNYTREAPGTRVEFMDYDPKKKGWFVYGHGKVSADGRQVVPDAKTRVWAFHGAMFNIPDWLPWDLPWVKDAFDWLSGDPVDLSTGMLTDSRTDLAVSDFRGSAEITRTYWQGDTRTRAFGIGRDLSYNVFLHSKKQYEQVDLYLPGGQSVPFVRTSPGTGFVDAVFEPVGTPSEYHGSKIVWGGDRTWHLKFRDGTTWIFPQYAPLKEIRDRHGNAVQLTRAGNKGEITQISTPGGRWMSLAYDTKKRVSSVRDNAGRTTSYTYDTAGRLSTVTDPANKVSSYTYDGTSNRIKTAKDARGITYMTNVYENGRVKEQTLTEGAKYTFAYTLTGTGKVTSTTVTQPGGSVRRVEFDAAGYGVKDTQAHGSTLARTTQYHRGPRHRVDAVTDPYGRRTELTYDTNGYITRTTELAGTPQARQSGTAVYNGPYDQPTTLTDPLSNTTTLAYDADGDLRTITDPENRKTALTYTPDGQVKTVTDASQAVTEYTYLNGEMVSVKDAEGRTSSQFLDAAGRPSALTDSAGSRTTLTYDALNQTRKVTDPLGQATALDYDENGNLTTLTDARNNATSWAYDNADRAKSATDPLGAQALFAYDPAGHLAKVTSRANQVATAEYDLLGRAKNTKYGVNVAGTAESTATYAYDAVDLPKTITDTQAGTQSFGYDAYDRPKTVTGPTGTIAYDYDAADRRSEMTAAGKTTLYGYDTSGILTSVTSGDQAVTFDLDAVGRENTAALPGGITRTTTLDKTGTIKNIGYAKGAAGIGDLTYTRDVRGLQTGLSGGLASVALPAAETGAVYGKDNRVTTFNGRSFTYDANGQLKNDGKRTYTWNARGQLSGLTATGGAPSLFTYDALGTRTAKTLGTTTKKYLTDGSNPLVEQNSTGATTATVATSGLDEYLTRTENNTTQIYLTDALGSIVGLANTDGTIATRYTYDPNGQPTTSGATSSNPYTFTGRESDGTGLLHYRNRYYDPESGRFISQDPIGHAGGTNLYQYALSSPTTYTDPTGNNPLLAGCVIGGLSEAGLDWLGQRLSGRKVNWGQVGTSAAMGCATGMLGAAGTAKGAAKGASLGKCFTAGNSFTSDTPVLLTDGTRKPIKDIRIGDEVLATDPETGESGPRPVTALIKGTGDKQLVDITLGTGTSHTLTATDGHPFWAPALNRWIQADKLTDGQWLQTSTGTWVQITAVTHRTTSTTVYNLTVADLHTYYVLAGTTPVLVHNIGPTPACDLTKPGPYAVESIPARSQSQRFTKAENDAINRIGDWFGCHSCGASSPGRPNWTPDHQPVSRFVLPGTPQRLYPHCMACSSRQGGLVGHMPADRGVPYIP
ncbi:RHS repeat-associated core domain-containing protein [Streptomyces anulatus]